MIRAGLCSITLRNLSIEEVIAVAVKAGVEGIEWVGSTHVPHGETETAAKAGALTRQAGLEVSSYGSYYRVGVSEAEGLTFASVLATAVALGAPTIRVWAGNRNYGEADDAFVKTVVEDTLRTADLAAAAGRSITFEYHGGSLTDRNVTAFRFSEQVRHPAVFFSWQPPHGYDVSHCLDGLRLLLPRLNTIHVFHWTMGSYEKNTVNETIRPLKHPQDFHMHPLADGADRWTEYFKAINGTGRSHFALLEFAKDGSPDQVIADGRTLRGLLESCRA